MPTTSGGCGRGRPTEYFVPGPGLEPLAEYVDVNGELHLKQEYLYADGRLLASVEPATTLAWGEAIVAGVTVIQKAHLTELRREVNAVRGRFGLSPAVWAVPDATLAGTFVVPAYIMELRTALTAIAPHDFGAALVAGQVILAADFTAIRDRITALRAGGERFYHLDTLGSVRAVTDSAGNMRPDNFARRRPIVTILLAVILVVLSQIVAAFVVGPIVRSTWGAPLDFDSDYTSGEALRHALFIQGICGVMAFMALGFLTNGWGSARVIRWSLLAASPLSVAVGFWLYRFVAPESTPEYSGYGIWFVMSVVGPVVFAPATVLGVRIRRTLKTRRESG